MHMSQLGFRLIDYLGNELGCSDKTSNHFDLDPSEKYFDGNEAESTEEEISEFFEALLTSSDTNSSLVSFANHSSGETLAKQVPEGVSSTTSSSAAEIAVSFATKTGTVVPAPQVPILTYASVYQAPSHLGYTSEERPLRSEAAVQGEHSDCESVSGYVSVVARRRRKDGETRRGENGSTPLVGVA